MVLKDEAAGRTRNRRRGARGHPDHPRKLARGVFPVDAKYPRLDVVAAALVGTPDSGMALRELQRDYRCARGAREVSEGRLDKPGAGPGGVGHVVPRGALAFCDARVAG